MTSDEALEFHARTLLEFLKERRDENPTRIRQIITGPVSKRDREGA